MKFQVKALAVALALVAAVPAQAALSLPNTGNGSLMLTVFDRVANVTSLFDLGFTYNDFNQSTAAGTVGVVGAASQSNQSWDLTTGDYATTWTALLAANAGLTSNLSFGVVAADNLGAYATGTGAQGYIATYAGVGSTVLSGPVITAVGALNTAIGNGTNANVITLVNTFPTTTGNGASLFAGVPGVFNVTGKLNNVGNPIMGAIGSTLSMEQVLTGASAIGASTTTIYAANTFTLSSTGMLSYVNTAAVAAVPEADTSAMMLAGLGLMGFIARRRNNKQA